MIVRLSVADTRLVRLPAHRVSILEPAYCLLLAVCWSHGDPWCCSPLGVAGFSPGSYGCQ